MHSSAPRRDRIGEAWSGIEECRRGDWETGFETLRRVASSDPAWKDLPGLYYSYLGFGLAAYQNKYKSGLKLCQVGIQRGSFEPENYLNQARIYWLRNRLDLASMALDRGLRIDPENRRLRRLRTVLGERQSSTLPFLPRSHRLNRILGQTRRHLQRRWRPAPQPSGESMIACWLK